VSDLSPAFILSAAGVVVTALGFFFGLRFKLDSVSDNIKLMWTKYDALDKEHTALSLEFVEVKTKVIDLVGRVDAHNSANIVNAVQGYTEMMKENLDRLDDRLDRLTPRG
jgi:hypothetical protein